MNNKLYELANEYNIIAVNKLHLDKNNKIVSVFCFEETESLNAFLKDKRYKDMNYKSNNIAAYDLYCHYNILNQQQQQFFID